MVHASDTRSLAEAAAKFAEVIEGEGGRCPCCDRWGKINAQHLDASKARALLWFRSHFLKHGYDWVHCATQAPRWMVGKNMFSTMKYWGLVESRPRDPAAPSKTKTSGMWRITPPGVAFAEGRTTARKTAWIYDDTVKNFSGPEVTIRACVGQFNYDEMMGSVFNDAARTGD